MRGQVLFGRRHKTCSVQANRQEHWLLLSGNKRIGRHAAVGYGARRIMLPGVCLVLQAFPGAGAFNFLLMATGFLQHTLLHAGASVQAAIRFRQHKQQ